MTVLKEIYLRMREIVVIFYESRSEKISALFCFLNIKKLQRAQGKYNSK